MNSNEVILHGEATVFPSSIPSAAKKKRVKRGAFVIVANSETTGNHHVVDTPEGVNFYETDSGTLFMESKVDTQIRCVHENRHDAITIPPGTYEFGTQQEYDPFAARMQQVRD
jgi:hypothetical protein